MYYRWDRQKQEDKLQRGQTEIRGFNTAGIDRNKRIYHRSERQEQEDLIKLG